MLTVSSSSTWAALIPTTGTVTVAALPSVATFLLPGVFRDFTVGANRCPQHIGIPISGDTLMIEPLNSGTLSTV